MTDEEPKKEAPKKVDPPVSNLWMQGDAKLRTNVIAEEDLSKKMIFDGNLRKEVKKEDKKD